MVGFLRSIRVYCWSKASGARRNAEVGQKTGRRMRAIRAEAQGIYLVSQGSYDSDAAAGRV